MSQLGQRALVSSHISSAFTQPIFYQVPPTASSRHQHQQPLTHASQKLVERLNNKKRRDAPQGRHQTNAQTGPLAQSFEEHAVYASTTSLQALGDALMRITHSGYVLELTLLDWADGTPVCWEFAERIVPMPGIAVTSPSQDVQAAARSRGLAVPSGQLAFVYVLLEGGTLYRLAFPLVPPLFHDENWVAKRGWCKEFTLPSTVSRPIGGTSGSMILQGEKTVVVTVNSGAVLRMEVDVDNDGQLREKLHYPQHHSLLSKMFRTAQEEDTIVSAVSASVSGSDILITLSRDRCLRAWDRQGGNTISIGISPGNNTSSEPVRGSSLIRGSSVTPQVAGSSIPQLLPPERRSLLRTFFTEDEENLSNFRILVFLPTPLGLGAGSSAHQPSSAGIFALYKMEGNRFKPLGEKETSMETIRCSLRDFMVMPNSQFRNLKEIHCLWEYSGESMYEYTELDIEVRRAHNGRNTSASGDVEMREVGSSSLPHELIYEDDDGEDFHPVDWHIVTPLAMPSNAASSLSPEPTADSVDFLSTIDFTSPNAAATILDALFRAGRGGFSPYTISEALNGYVEAAWVSTDQVDPIKDPNSRLRAALSRQYPTLRARVSAIVGCRLQAPEVFSDPASANPFNASVIAEPENEMAIAQHTELDVAFRRDWEGFLARCREIEKAGSWPVALGLVGSKKPGGARSSQNTTSGHCVILERERMGLMVTEDGPLDLYRQTLSKMQEDETTNGYDARESIEASEAPQYLVYTALSFRALFSPASWADVAHELYNTMHNTVQFVYHDLLVDLAFKLEIMDLDIDTIEWVFERVDSLGGNESFNTALQAISALVRTTGIAKELDSVKQEDDEEEVDRMLLQPDPNQSLLADASNAAILPGTRPADYHNQWSRSLTAVYLSATLQARYEIASSILFLLIFIVARGGEANYFSGLPNAVVIDELFAGLRSASMLRQTAARVVESSTVTRPAPGPPSALAPSRTIARHVRAGTADSMVRQLAGMRVAPAPSVQFAIQPKPHVHFASPTGSSFPTLPPTTRGSGSITLLQSLLPPLRRPFSLPYASDAFLEFNGIIQADSMLVAGYDEVRFAEELRRKGHTQGAADVIDWLPKTNACCYVAARLQLQKGEYGEASTMFEHSARSFGPLSYKTGVEEATLVAVLPPSLGDLSSLAAYYDHVAKLFEAEAQYGMAVLFYRLAIESANDDEPTTDLWYNIFKGELALENFERAYTTLAEMSEQPVLRTNSVTELVTKMCERNKVETLLSFNFVGFADDVEQALGFKARNADPLDRPVYSKIYYAWAVKKGDYRAAASTMYQRARILGQQDKPDTDTRFMLMSLQLEAYTVAINALCLLDPEDAWISLPVYDESGELPPEWRRSNFGIDVGERGGNDSEIVELDDMRREMELCRARRHLVYMMAGLNRVQQATEVDEKDFSISPMEVLRRYCQLARYEEALYSARVFRADMTVIFTMMVDMCMRLSKGGEAALTPFEERWLLQDRAMIWEGEPISKAWRLLQDSLERHDTSDSGWQYRKTCLERILEADRSSSPPTWLATFFQDREPEYLIRTCMRYHLILPALDYTLLMIQNANQPFDKGATVAVTQTRLPYPLIDAVVAAAQTEDEVHKAAGIKAEIEARIGKMGRWEWS
ncbi:hypothetical protein PIIN_02000 [Serendipita indica DSM 11827]|uniref:Nuclear pore complex protein Nup160 n=1 Tax=Serendipita indica (strain DSM 11827) TaxID=1109443 RepID=G4T9Z8_SERID|nr:hypothetical protein PIIN_02000 [Serendipita indica DSM 11827]